MKAIIQRVKKAKVFINDKVIGEIGKGMVVFLGVRKGDTPGDAQYLAEKILNLRIFDDKNQKMNLSLMDIKGEVLIVSEFTLYGDCSKGRRPDFIEAAPQDCALQLYNLFVELIKKSNFKIVTGEFKAYMIVEIHNDGPATFLLESKK